MLSNIGVVLCSIVCFVFIFYGSDLFVALENLFFPPSTVKSNDYFIVLFFFFFLEFSFVSGLNFIGKKKREKKNL